MANLYVKFYLICVCVDDVVRLGVHGALERVQIFILAERLKIEFLTLSGRESCLVQTYCESCEQLHYPSIRQHDSEICDSRLSYLNENHTLVFLAPVSLGALMKTIFPHLWGRTISVRQA